MKKQTHAEILTLSKQSEAVTADLHRKLEIARKDIEEIAESYSGKKSSFLVGVVGAAFGGVGGGLALHGALIAVSGPVGAALGAALFLLAWRGPAQFQLERATDRMRIALDAIHAQITMLSQDDNTPRDVIDGWWRGYSEIRDQCLRVATRSIDNSLPSLPS